ncbi:MAG: FtsW/RodA/SpoVE family cell cycle protein [Phycisphaeraceae bacterium]|nr:FtsW/RodA/SpoVE family cell cycle protein [Phycisphaeraceae bacterium]
MNSWLDKLRDLLRPHPGWLAIVPAAGLTLVGIAAIATVAPDHAKDQARWFLLGLGVMWLCMMPHPKQIGRAAMPLAVLITVILLLIVLPGMPRGLVPVRNGIRAWINLHFMMLQPSESAKIIFVLTLAWYLRHRRSYRFFAGLLVPFLILCLPVALILLEPDLGTAILFFPVLLGILLVAGARLRHLGAIVGLAMLVIGLNVAAIYLLPDSMQLLQAHQRARIKATISQAKGETRYLQDVGFQQDKSVTLIGAGGWGGLGAERAETLIGFNHLPENHNDMIFAVVVSRWGFLGGIGLMALYGLLLGAMLLVALTNKDPFSRLAVVGFAVLFFSQTVINIGMAIGLLPIIGITLPFVSYGGSSLVASFAIIGLVMNFAAQRPTIVQRPSFEYDNPQTIFE